LRERMRSGVPLCGDGRLAFIGSLPLMAGIDAFSAGWCKRPGSNVKRAVDRFLARDFYAGPWRRWLSASRASNRMSSLRRSTYR
jgi:hypothetical protein